MLRGGGLKRDAPANQVGRQRGKRRASFVQGQSDGMSIHQGVDQSRMKNGGQREVVNWTGLEVGPESDQVGVAEGQID
jgi:hypothetical protein